MVLFLLTSVRFVEYFLIRLQGAYIHTRDDLLSLFFVNRIRSTRASEPAAKGRFSPCRGFLFESGTQSKGRSPRAKIHVWNGRQVGCHRSHEKIRRRFFNSYAVKTSPKIQAYYFNVFSTSKSDPHNKKQKMLSRGIRTVTYARFLTDHPKSNSINACWQTV